MYKNDKLEKKIDLNWKFLIRVKNLSSLKKDIKLRSHYKRSPLVLKLSLRNPSLL